jgi:hypothetical protein
MLFPREILSLVQNNPANPEKLNRLMKNIESKPGSENLEDSPFSNKCKIRSKHSFFEAEGCTKVSR